MKIATFNIWNSDRGMPLREQLIIDEIKSVDSDVLCLQEVKLEAFNKLKDELIDYAFNYYHEANDECDGLAVFCKYPILTTDYNNCAIYATYQFENKTYLVVNVHLPWDSIGKKERYIVGIIKTIDGIESDYALLTGDFNCSGHSSVHHFITGQRTLLNSETTPYWFDLAEVHAEQSNTNLEVTLDLINNPRWKGKDSAETSQRFDRIYVRDAYPKPSAQLKYFSLFGKTVDEQSEYCASDHYGVVAEIKVD